MENKFIIVVVVTLLLIALAQLMKVYDLASRSRGDRSEEKVTRGENILNANLLLVFMIVYFGSIVWLIFKYGMTGGLFDAASEHGVELDSLLLFNWWIILPVFFLTNGVLFVFSWKYYYREERKAYYYPHNNKLELIWTIVPAVVLSAIVIYGLKTWNDIMYNDTKGAKLVEVYGEQFKWHTRYAGPGGDQNVLGKADYKLITMANPLGIITEEYIQDSYETIDKEVLAIEKILSKSQSKGEYYLPYAEVDSLKNKMDRLKRQKYRIKASIDKGEQNVEIYKHAYDDVLVKELRLVKGQPYSFRFRSKDVIHCPWIPHMRMQINAVPGMETRFDMTPTITTKEMRAKPEVIDHYREINIIHNDRLAKGLPVGGPDNEVQNLKFKYILMCNKICGAQHSNMKMDVVVETQDEFDDWYNQEATIDQTISNQIASLIKKKIDALSGYESKTDQVDVYRLSTKYARIIFDNMSDETKKVLLQVENEGDPKDYDLLQNKLETAEQNIANLENG
jgi:cytochrome c oxidase subunit 2